MREAPERKEAPPPEGPGRGASQNILELDGSFDSADDDAAQVPRRFDWLADSDIVVREQPAIAVYASPVGIVLRRERQWNEEDDAEIWFQPYHAVDLCRAILEAAGLDVSHLLPESRHSRSRPQDATAAERQRRYRERKRQASFDHDPTA